MGPLPLGLTESGNLRQQTMVMYALCIPGVVSALFVMACKMKPLIPRSSKASAHARPLSGTTRKRDNVELQGLLEASKEEEEDDDDAAMG